MDVTIPGISSRADHKLVKPSVRSDSVAAYIAPSQCMVFSYTVAIVYIYISSYLVGDLSLYLALWNKVTF